LFAQDVLDWSEKKFPEFFRALHYRLVETSPTLRKRLQATLERHFAAGKTSLCSGSLTPGKGETSVLPNRAALGRALAPEVPVIVFANEFFDALPVEVLSPQGELHISEKDGRLVESWNAAPSDALEFLDRYSAHPEAGERVEAPLAAQHCMSQIAATVKRGFMIAIDYGYTREEQLAGRHRGTIAAYRQHSESANPYEAPGEQDITAHVNFTALAAAAQRGGMQVQPLLTQSQFLLGIGEDSQFADAFEGCQLPQERVKAALQLKHLVTPEGMGESFHVLIASKDINTEQMSKVSGLSFGKPTQI
jgi:SAM-dependent MidA family methyltransferase